MDSGYTSWTIEDFNTALARKYASDRPVMAPWRREAAEAANVAAGNMPIHDVFTGRSARAAKARQALCEGRQAMGWHPWTIANYYGIAPEMVSEALGEDGAPEWLELQETLTRRKPRWLGYKTVFKIEPTPNGNQFASWLSLLDRQKTKPAAALSLIGAIRQPVTLDSATLEPNKCQCRRCDPGLGPNGLPERFIVCGTCGCKRCPRAEWHGYECSGSNEVGQTPKPVVTVDAKAKALHRDAMSLADQADERKRAGDMAEAKRLYGLAADAEEQAAAMTVVEPSHGVLLESAEALRGQAEQTGGLSGGRQVDEMVAGLMKAGGKSDGERRGDVGEVSTGCGPVDRSGAGDRAGAVDGHGEELDLVEARVSRPAADRTGANGAQVEAREGPQEAEAEAPQVAALKAEIERLKEQLAAKPALANIERPVTVEILKPHAGPSVLTVTSKYPPIVIDRNAPNEGVTVGGVRYEPPRKRPIVQDAPPKPKKKGGAQRLREKRLAAEKAPCSATVAERAATKIVKAKPVKAPKVEEPAPKPVEPKPPVRMVPLPRRPAGAARCDCGLAVQHTGSDGVGRCTRCATTAYRMKQGAAE